MRLLADWLRERGHDVTVTREPGGTPGAECVRHVILSGRAQALGVDMEAALFAAARRDNVERNIRPALAKGSVVVCDRFMDSSRVYQSAVGGVDASFLKRLEDAAVEGARPDLTLILDMPAERSVVRMRARQGEGADDRFERDALETHAKRREAFLAIARAEPGRCDVVDADRDAEAVASDVRTIVGRRLEGLQGE